MDDGKRILDAAAQRGIRVVSFTGGEPFLLFDDLLVWISHAAHLGIDYIRTGTNGFFLCRPGSPGFISRVERIADRLAATPLRNLWISLDSASTETHENMRGLLGVVRGIEKALPIFHRRRIYPAANLGLNRHIGGEGKEALPVVSNPQNSEESAAFFEACKKGLRRFFDRVANMGFTLVNLCYPMSDPKSRRGDDLRPVYAAASADRVVRFEPWERTMLFEAAVEVIPEYRSRIRIFSPRSSLFALARQSCDPFGVTYPCRGGIDFFFVDAARGDTYPCGYRGDENLGKLWDLHPQTGTAAPPCRRCDWECFRDPSELFGPLLEARCAPRRLLRRIRRNPRAFRLWLEDLAYYSRCAFFDGRKPPRLTAVERFQGPESRAKAS